MSLRTRHAGSVHTCITYSARAVGNYDICERADLCGHALWYLVLVVVLVVVVMALFRGGGGGDGRWRAYSLCVAPKCIMDVLKDVRILWVLHDRREYGT